MKTSELSDTALDWAVAKAIGMRVEILDFDELGCGCVQAEPDPFMNHSRCWAPSRYWQQAGPIIETYEVSVNPEETGVWRAGFDYGDRRGLIWGEHPCEAAMRCVVLAAFGHEIDIPEELAARVGRELT